MKAFTIFVFALVFSMGCIAYAGGFEGNGGSKGKGHSTQSAADLGEKSGIDHN